MLPKIKSEEDLLIAYLGDELVVYDLTRDQRHSFNSIVAFIFQQCDGKTTPAAMAERLHTEMNIPHAERVTWQALDRLEHARLLTQRLEKPAGLLVNYTCKLTLPQPLES